MRRHVVLLVALNFVCALPAWSQAASAANAGTDSSSSSGNAVGHALQISGGDLLEVNVFDTPDISGKVRVDEHGDISLPLAGSLMVSGMTAEQAAHAIEKKLVSLDILKEPHVSLTILEYATQGVAILGEVKNPGVYPLLGAHNLLDLISAAGGMTPNAGKAVTITHRTEPDKPIIVKIETKPGSSAAFNVDIRPGDTIAVSHAGIVYVVGDVAKPGGFLIETNDRLTVLQAMALAQGANKTASLNGAKLLRKKDDGREELMVPLKKILSNKAPDQALADGDILFVPSSATKTAMVTMQSVLPSVATAAIYHVP
jgi:polysaccharide export outer membrane protein